MLQSSQTVMDLLSHCGHNSELHLKEMRNTILNLFLFDFLNLFLSLFSFTPPFLVDRFLDPRKVFFYPRIYCQIVPSGTAFPPVHLDRKQHKTIGKHEKKPNHAN